MKAMAAVIVLCIGASASPLRAQSAVVLDQGTLTTDVPAISTTATLNDAGTVFTHWKVDVSGVSGAGSKFVDFASGGTSKASIGVGGSFIGESFTQRSASGLQGFFTSANAISAGFANADLGNDAAGFTLFVGNNSNGSNSNPGTLQLTSGIGGGYYLWVSSGGTLYIGTTAPAGATSDTSGTVVGSQSSTLDSKIIEGPFRENRAALDTILRTNLYRFRYKAGDFTDTRYVGLVTDESPEFGQYPDEQHPNGRSLNVVTAIGYLMAAVKEQQAEIEILRQRVGESVK